ncbi:MAG: hypothetical protein ACPL7D_04595 [Candidatus Sumerlaeaceae bacterium]|jgi:hypothetical protein
MPHVIFRGAVALQDAWEGFTPLLVNEHGWLTKVTDCFLNGRRTCMLLESTAVFQGVTHNFYVRVDQKQDQVTVRVEPRTNVEKNEGVKRAVAIVSRFLAQRFPYLIFDKSNLPPEMLSELEDKQ